MKYVTMVIMVAMMGVFCGGTPAAAEEPKIGLVDLARTFDSFQRTKDSEKVLEAEAAKKKEERDKRIDEIKRLKGELELLNEKGKAEKQAVIDQKIQELQAFDRDVQDGLRRERDRAIQEILKEIDGVIETFGRENGYTMLLNDRALLYGKKEMDITDQIIEILNKGYQAKEKKR